MLLQWRQALSSYDSKSAVDRPNPGVLQRRAIRQLGDDYDTASRILGIKADPTLLSDSPPAA
jgi:hypothetical protein